MSIRIIRLSPEYPRVKPLTSLLVIVGLIEATTTTKGLKVKAKLDEKIHLLVQIDCQNKNSLKCYS